jgi:antitoxin VapB
MALSIKSEEADRLARELSATTGESLTEAVTVALSERLERERARRATDRAGSVRRLRDEVRALEVLDDRAPEEILGYAAHGLPG